GEVLGADVRGTAAEPAVPGVELCRYLEGRAHHVAHGRSLPAGPNTCRSSTSSAPGTSRTGRTWGPMYLAAGRTSRPVRFCSRMGAAQPPGRAPGDIQGDLRRGTPPQATP